MMGTENVLAYYREDLATSSGFPDPGKVWARFRKGEVSAQPGTGETSTPTGLRAALGKNRDDTIRTCDHLLPKQALYQLSYIPGRLTKFLTKHFHSLLQRVDSLF
jgi:hypothetical protein